jgi:hypothetical protein
MNKARIFSPHWFAADRAIARRRDPARPGGFELRRRRLAALVQELGGHGATARLRLGLLRSLDQFGPQVAAEMPRAWPITRQHVRRAIRWLTDDGLVEIVSDGSGSGSVRLTGDGRRVVDEIDWSETVHSMERAGEL